MEKLSNAQVSQFLKTASGTLRALSEENVSLKEKVAFYEKKERAEKIAEAMDQKGLEPDLSLAEKVAGLMKRDDLDIVEEAVSMSAPQMKLASVYEDGIVSGGGDSETERAAIEFAARLASLGD